MARRSAATSIARPMAGIALMLASLVAAALAGADDGHAAQVVASAKPSTAPAALQHVQGFQVQIGGGRISGSIGGSRGGIGRIDRGPSRIGGGPGRIGRGPGRDDDNSRRPGRDRIRPGIIIRPPSIEIDRPPSRVACIGGRATRSGCVCSNGRHAVKTGNRVYRCVGGGRDPDRTDVACAGGSVRRGACVCDRGDRRVRVGRSSYRCVGRPDDNVADVTCRGGKVSDGDCVCPRRQRRLTLGRNAFRCLPGPIIAVPVPVVPPLIVEPPRRPIAKVPPARRDPPRPGRPARAPAPTIAVADIPEFVPDEVLVTVPLASPETVDDAIATSFGIELIERQPLGLAGARIVRYRIPDGRSVPAVIVALSADTRLSGPQPNYLYHQLADKAATVSKDVLEIQYALVKLAALDAQSIASGKNTLVAVIDSGIDADHDDLDRSVADSLDTVALDPRIGTPMELTNSHGTAVAGIIAGHGEVRGIAPAARLLDVRAFTPGIAATPLGTTMRIVKGLEWALARGARVVNMSFAGPRDRLMGTAIAEAINRNIMIVAAAGNNGPTAPPVYPAAYDGVIAVTATDPDDALYEKANRGSYVAVAAPGVELFVPALDNAHQIETGTSFAAAYVSGALGLLLEREPGLSVGDARAALVAGADDLGTPGRDDGFGAGRINALSSLRARMAPGPGMVAHK